jgi:hypothetical protein
MTSFILAEGYKLFKGTQSALEIEAVCFSESSVAAYQPIHCNFRCNEDHGLHIDMNNRVRH